jgi:hypothetical protein
MALAGTGTLHIDDSCVTMTLATGENLLLVWLSSEVRWDDSQQITYTSSSISGAAPITIRDGDTVTVGGEPLPDDEPVTRNLVWLATPQASCEDGKWIVNSLAKS